MSAETDLLVLVCYPLAVTWGTSRFPYTRPFNVLFLFFSVPNELPTGPMNYPKIEAQFYVYIGLWVIFMR